MTDMVKINHAPANTVQTITKSRIISGSSPIAKIQ
uniref:Uncharacterized protein n=1 Tax=Anguilla anguilla TaxID=7936 RepID=A0A0E9RGU3_ANGAN